MAKSSDSEYSADELLFDNPASASTAPKPIDDESSEDELLFEQPASATMPPQPIRRESSTDELVMGPYAITPPPPSPPPHSSIPTLDRPPITPRPMRSLPNPLRTPGNKGTSGQMDYVEKFHRSSVDQYVAEDLETHRVFFPIDIFLHVFLGLPKDWKTDNGISALIKSVMKTPRYSKAVAAFKKTCVNGVQHEHELYDDYIDMCNAATTTVAAKDKGEKKGALWSYRQDHDAVVGCSVKVTPDVITVAEQLWRESLNTMRTGAGPVNDMAWAHAQVIHDLKPEECYLDRGSTSPFTLLGLDGLDPRDLRQLIRAVDKAEKRQGLPPDFSNSLRSAKKRRFQSSPADMPIAKRSKSNAPLPTIAASVGQAPAALTIKPQDDAGKRLESSLQCARYALEVLSSAGFRSHSFGLLIGVNEIQIVYYDRSIIAVSQPFTMVDLKRKGLKPTEDERRFVALLICLQRATLVQRGIMECLMPDPFLEVYQNYTKGMASDPKTLFVGRKIRLQVGGKTVYVKLGRILMRQPGIIGRNTCVVEATSKAWPGKDLVVKISWPAASRVPENTFVDKITESVRAEGDDAKWVLDHIPTVLHSQDFALPPEAPGSRLREYLAGPGVKFADGKVFDYELRVCRVSVQERLQRLDTLTKPEDYAQVVFDVFQVHRWIYDVPRIMHRDMSHGNIMWHIRNGRIRGVLNDFDLSSYRDATSGSSKQRTGTRPFMAHELHNSDANGNPPVHLYRHDLESIFYIIILLTCAYALMKEPGNDGSYLQPDRSPESYRPWFSMTDARLYGEKRLLIIDPSSTPTPNKSFKGFAVWMDEMHTQFNKGVLDKARALKAATLAAEEDEEEDEDSETDEDDQEDMEVDAAPSFDDGTLDGAVSYGSILEIMKTFWKYGRGKNGRNKAKSLEVMYPIAKKL